MSKPTVRYPTMFQELLVLPPKPPPRISKLTNDTADTISSSTGVAENHTMAKDILAGFAGAEADRLVETKGEDFYDREKMKRDAQNNANNYYDRQYQGGGDSGYDGGNQGRDSGYGGNQGGDSGY